MTIENLKQELFRLSLADQLEIVMEVMRRVKQEVPLVATDTTVFTIPEEVMQHIEDIENGKVKMIPIDDAINQINKKYGI